MPAVPADTAALAPHPPAPAAPVAPILPAAPAAPRFPLLSALSNPSFALFWAATILIFAAQEFRNLPLASLALDITGRPSGLANVQSVGAIVTTVMVLFGGLAADRFRPGRVVIISLLLFTLSSAALAVLVLLGQLHYWHLIAFSVVGGIAGGIYSGAYFAILPHLLPDDHLRAGNALTTFTENLSRFLMPPLAGFTLAAAGAPPALAAAALATALAAAMLSQIRVVSTAGATAPTGTDAAGPLATSPTSQSGVIARLLEGLRASRRDGAVWTLIWAGAILIPGTFGATAVGVPSLAKLTLNAGDAGIGILYGAFGAGALLGALAAGAVRSVRRPGLATAAGIIAEGVALIGAGLAPTLWIAAGLLAASGLFQAIRFVLAVTILQTRPDPAARGRVLALAVFAAVAPQTVVLALAGYIGDVFGPRTVITLGGSLVVLGGALIASRKPIRALTA